MPASDDTTENSTAAESLGQSIGLSISQRPLDYIADEHARVRSRRTISDVERPPGKNHAPWALAFSGGGIRSATFCLGVLQGLTKAEAPAQLVGARNSNSVLRRGLIRQFDYLSTVGGGGFIGSFFISLFGARRLNRLTHLDDTETAEHAYQVFEEDPPGRLHGFYSFDPARPGTGPLAWLRENGCYVVPKGSSDMWYVTALALRNWFAVHYVLGTILLSLYLLLAFTHVAVMYCLDGLDWDNIVRKYEAELIKSVIRGDSVLWWSPAWWLMVPLLIWWLVPAGIAYWLAHPQLGQDLRSVPRHITAGSAGTGIIGMTLLAIAWFGQHAFGDQFYVANTLGLIGYLVATGAVWYSVTRTFHLKGTISAQQIALTRALKTGLVCLVGVASFATVHTVAQSIYVLSASQVLETMSVLQSAGAVGIILWVVRKLTEAFEDTERTGWRAKLPLETVVTAMGVALLFLVAVFWAWVVLWIQWRGSPPNLELLENVAAHGVVVLVLGIVFTLVLALAIVVGRFPELLNHSTLLGFYSTRLTQTYLGASNGVRFDESGNTRWRSVAESAPADHMTLRQYYSAICAPIHIINVCLNQNIDPAELRVQPNRKGKPLAILPSGFTLDGAHYAMPEATDASGLRAPLTVGEWVGVSGTALSIGAGRNEGLGYALLTGLANFRLGRWWESGVLHGYSSTTSRRVRQLFKTQSYLLDELLARFYGTRRSLQYLSDGGHFENTGLYELLRPTRGVRLTVACDCGSDPHYRFLDLANAIRLARIDFGTQVEIDRKVATDKLLGQVFGTPDQFLRDCKDEYAADKFALLLNVYHSDLSYREQRPDARVVLIKPRLIPKVSAAIGGYLVTDTMFPHKPNQFNDEALWEDYRKLGLELTKLVFGAGTGADREDFANALWHVLLS